jgi:hypothetical protein
MKSIIEQYGMYGMSKRELRGLIAKHIERRNEKSRMIVAAARRVETYKIWLGYE